MRQHRQSNSPNGSYPLKRLTIVPMREHRDLHRDRQRVAKHTMVTASINDISRDCIFAFVFRAMRMRAFKVGSGPSPPDTGGLSGARRTHDVR
jgi:hypothetical protein